MNQGDTSKDKDLAAARRREAQTAQVDPTETTLPMPLQAEGDWPVPPARGGRRAAVDVPLDE